MTYPVYNDYDENEEPEEFSPVDIPPVIIGPGLSGGLGSTATTTGPWIPPAPGSAPGTQGSAPPPDPASPSIPPGGANGVRACDKRTDLYVLQADRLNMSQPLKGKLTNCHVTGCER